MHPRIAEHLHAPQLGDRFASGVAKRPVDDVLVAVAVDQQHREGRCIGQRQQGLLDAAGETLANDAAARPAAVRVDQGLGLGREHQRACAPVARQRKGFGDPSRVGGFADPRFGTHLSVAVVDRVVRPHAVEGREHQTLGRRPLGPAQVLDIAAECRAQVGLALDRDRP